MEIIMKEIKLSCGTITLTENSISTEGIKETISFYPESVENKHVSSHNAHEYNNAIDGLESLLLALHCAGVDIGTSQYKEAIETAVEAIANNLGCI